MSAADKAKHALEEVAGKAKKGLGDVTNNDDMKAEGQADVSKANAKQAGDKAKDAAGDVKDAFTK